MAGAFLSSPPKAKRSQEKGEKIGQRREKRIRKGVERQQCPRVSVPFCFLMSKYVHTCTCMWKVLQCEARGQQQVPSSITGHFISGQALSLTLGPIGCSANTRILLPPHPQPWGYRCVFCHTQLFNVGAQTLSSGLGPHVAVMLY